MNISDVVTLFKNDLLAAVDFSPAYAFGGSFRCFEVQIWLKTPIKNKFTQIAFDTDRPFLNESEVISLFHTAGIPKSRIHYVVPFGSANYQTAEVL